jgi:hypothetical protein
MLFSETAFMRDFNAEDHAEESNCTEALVNAMCAMACNLLDIATTLNSGQFDVSDRLELQNAFMDEARKHIVKHSTKKPTSAQAFAVMFLVELSAGRGRTGSSYIRTAAERTPAELYGDRHQPWQISRWGVHTLTT